ncbi:hypothetical protein H2203_008102 [Taxawa tesnikishii (nom. ined.)]|nr:hypothetical protein H2203_008102 [Dothideales sp. JES 119]
MAVLVAVLLSLLHLTAAHFTVQYPWWRGDAFADDASEWIWPCANISQDTSANNRTAWPLTGGSVSMHVSHPFAFTYINLGLGNTVTNFNISLLGDFNQTGNGSFCLPQVGRAALAQAGIVAGTNASLQFVQISHTGNALYNEKEAATNTTAAAASGTASAAAQTSSQTGAASGLGAVPAFVALAAVVVATALVA